MSAISINVGPITGDTVSAVSVVTLVRGDTGSTPSGVTLPIALALAGSSWNGTFTDASPAAYYLATYTIIYSDAGESGPLPLTISGSVGSATGFWTNQTSIERFLGSVLGGQLSNLTMADGNADPSGYADAIQFAESAIDYELFLFGYPTSKTSPQFSTSSFAYQAFNNAATVLAAYWLYAKRGIAEKDMPGAGGKFEKLKDDALCEIRKIIRNRIPDVTRVGYTGRPAVLLSGSVYGYGKPVLPNANLIPTVP